MTAQSRGGDAQRREGPDDLRLAAARRGVRGPGRAEQRRGARRRRDEEVRPQAEDLLFFWVRWGSLGFFRVA